MTETTRTHDNVRTTVHGPVERSMSGHVSGPTQGRSLCTDTTPASAASAEHGKDMVKLPFYHDGADGAHFL